MQWSPEQAAALDVAGAWLDDPHGKPVFRLYGFAGTGKTELAKHLASGVGRALFAAPTGKAASVMIERGCLGASTCHSLIYQPKDKPRKSLVELQQKLELATNDVVRRELQRAIDVELMNLRRPAFSLRTEDCSLLGADLLVVDEGSMVDNSLAFDLESFKVPILVLGDPFQIPPVFGSSPWVSDDVKPDVMLTEPHRHALDSAVLRYATALRKGERFAEDHPDVRFVCKGELSTGEVASYDQVLVGRNATRRNVNRLVRKHLEHDGLYPVTGDRLVCLRNDRETGLLNGTIATAVTDSNRVDAFHVIFGIETDDGKLLDVLAHTAHFLEYAEPGAANRIPPWERKEAHEFDYAYALTTHKAQGSQWKTGFVIDESGYFGPQAQRHRYTQATRFSRSIAVLG